MQITLKNIQYHPNSEPVALLMEHALGSFFLNTTQTALNARANEGVWDDPEALAEAQHLLATLPQYEGQGFTVVLP